ncbi:MAG: hypothetical protein Q8M39_04005 [Sulfuricurvum sp.]|nr:hypothetical protein [Sulfuricurvum sp.]
MSEIKEYLKWVCDFVIHPNISLEKFNLKKSLIISLTGLFLSLLTINIFFQISEYIFSFGSVLKESLNPWYGSLMILYYVILLAAILGLLAHILLFFRIKDLWLKILFHFVKVSTVLIPIFTILFFIATDQMLSKTFQEEYSNLQLGFGMLLIFILLSLIIWLLILPLATFFKMYTNSFKSYGVAINSFIIMLCVGQYVSYPYSSEIFSQKYFQKEIVKTLYEDGKMEKDKVDEINEKIRKNKIQIRD